MSEEQIRLLLRRYVPPLTLAQVEEIVAAVMQLLPKPETKKGTR